MGSKLLKKAEGISLQKMACVFCIGCSALMLSGQVFLGLLLMQNITPPLSKLSDTSPFMTVCVFTSKELEMQLWFTASMQWDICLLLILGDRDLNIKARKCNILFEQLKSWKKYFVPLNFSIMFRKLTALEYWHQNILKLLWVQ
jgi:hypothetical protein